MRAELDGSVGHDPYHGSRVAPPQTEQPILHVRTVDEPEGLLETLYVELGADLDGLHILIY